MTAVLIAAGPTGALIVVFWALAEATERRNRRKWAARRSDRTPPERVEEFLRKGFSDRPARRGRS